jgi:hypothetical protein
MKLLILNGPRDPRAAKYPQYRGTYRAHPTYFEPLPSEHEINKLFHWFLEEGGEDGVVHDLPRAFRYAQLLNQNVTGIKQFEVVEVTDVETSQIGLDLLGFDLSAGYNNSLLSWGLERQPGVNGLSEPIRELVDLVCRSYGPRLNPNGLFQEPGPALECLRSMDALQSLSPNLFEGGELKGKFSVVGLYLRKD